MRYDYVWLLMGGLVAAGVAVAGCGQNRHRVPCPGGECAPAGDTGTQRDAGTDCEGCRMGPEGECVEGVYNVACGSGGELCRTCREGEMCSMEGECEPIGCSAETCDGCCYDGTCQSGLKDFACGSGGELCTGCSEEEHCSPEGRCIACEDGCWSEEDECLDGTAPEACGSGGNRCESCGSEEICEEGECVEPVDESCSATCMGCCEEGTCRQGAADSACGRGGAACQTCPNGFECDGSGTCSVPSGSRWDVIAVETTIVESTVGGDPTDGPDPKLKVTVGGNSGESSVVDNSYRASWNEVVVEGASAGGIKADMSYEMVDDDIGGDDVIVSDCTAGFTDEDFARDQISHTCIGGDSARTRAEVVFRLDPL